LSLIRKNHFSDGIYSAREFQAVIQRECFRSDRSGSAFSLMVFTPRDGRSNKRDSLKIATVLTERVRSTDEVGWIGKKCLGVVLPDTPSEQARILAQDLHSRIGEGHINGLRIYGYPWNGYGRPSEDRSVYPSGASESESGQDNPHFAEPRNGDSEEGIGRFLNCGSPRWKRVVDILGGSICLLLFFPVGLAVAVLIKTVSPGPLFFRQERLGYLGKPFTLWKFRTMAMNTNTEVHEEHLRNLIRSDTPMKKLDDNADARMIPLGKLLRQLGLDELPQLINVLRGEMSLIGPRPCLEYEANQYEIWHRGRFNALPGLTGLWQVNGKNKTTHSEMMRLDINYVQRKSFLLDLKITLMTWPAIIQQALESSSLGKGGKHEKSN
jgi:lipopolysaccharide/colanic/teichoic acid biosynthesis glycosyltransferase